MVLRLKARKGVFVVITAIMMTSMVALVALSVDFARMSSLKNELQTSADAGALGGAIELLPMRTGIATDSARSYAQRNKAMQASGVVTVDSVILGHFDPVAWTFTAGGAPTDAIQTVVSRQASALFMQGFGVTMPRIKARATAWAAAPVVTTGCMRPWTIPYPRLRDRMNAYQGIANTPQNLVAPFTTADLTTLMSMPPSSRQFELHLGGGSGNNVDSLDVSMAGNYQAVIMAPKRYDAQTGISYGGSISESAQTYRDDVAGVNCYEISVGDTLATKTGLSGANNTVGPLLITAGTPNAVCVTIAGYTDNTPTSNSTYGDCRDGSSPPKAPTVVAAYYVCVSACTGKSEVAIMMLGAFTIDKVFSNNSNNPPMDVAEIKGTFSALGTSDGRPTYSGGSSPVLKVVLVR